MGQKNEAMLSYLEDDGRFADLFNQSYFGGRQVVDARELEEASEAYHEKPGVKGGGRARDLKKRLKSGRELKILAVESQSEINYIMPWRVMDYDSREYGEQIRKAQRENRRRDKAGEEVYKSAGERMSGMGREERLAPVYTICLYHGAEPWDGPRSLKDMMDFGEAGEEAGGSEWEEHFADYPLHLVSVCEPMDCSGFRTSLKELFTILPYHGDKKRLKEFMGKASAYRRLDDETASTISVLLGIGKYEEEKEKYRTEEGEYDLCKAIEDMMEDSRQEGIVEGEARGEARGDARRIISVTESIMKNLHCTLERACEIAGMPLAEYRQAKTML